MEVRFILRRGEANRVVFFLQEGGVGDDMSVKETVLVGHMQGENTPAMVSDILGDCNGSHSYCDLFIYKPCENIYC